MMSNRNRDLVLLEQGRTLIISERRGATLVKLMEITAGAVTQAQLAYYKANLEGKVKQIHADLILKYFYGINIE